MIIELSLSYLEQITEQGSSDYFFRKFWPHSYRGMRFDKCQGCDLGLCVIVAWDRRDKMNNDHHMSNI